MKYRAKFSHTAIPPLNPNSFIKDDKKKLAIIGGYLTIFDEDQKKRRVWSKRWYLERQKYSHVSLLQELEIREPTDLHNFLRMDKESFETLLEAVRFKIERKNTQMREAVSARFAKPIRACIHTRRFVLSAVGARRLGRRTASRTNPASDRLHITRSVRWICLTDKYIAHIRV
nr:unnamed protein product [Callosobruchus chinensis]